MMDLLVRVFHHYGLLALFTLSVMGYGLVVMRLVLDRRQLLPSQAIPLSIALGMGVLILCLITVASFGWLNSLVAAVLLVLGLVLMGFQWALLREMVTRRHEFRASAADVGWFILIACVLLSMSILPLHPPMHWDELMYHLPYAQWWADTGTLGVNETMRFPLMTYHMEVLYSAALLFGQDVLTHGMHSLLALVTVFLLYDLGRKHYGRAMAATAVLMTLFASRYLWPTAYVDLAVMGFYCCAGACLVIRQSDSQPGWVYLSMAFAGLAVATKYQALVFLPVYGAALLVVERRFGVLARATAWFLVFGAFWYVRNVIYVGNPVHPIGSSIFGYWNWSEVDVTRLNQDLDSVRAWPPLYLLLFAGLFLFWSGMSRLQRGILVFSAAGTLVWWGISAYPRYLVPLVPWLSLCAAAFTVRTARLTRITAKMGNLSPALKRSMLAVLCLLGLVGAGSDVLKQGEVLISPQEQEEYLRQRYAAKELMETLEGRPDGLIFQMGFEGERYFIGEPVMGDWFGPGRYFDVFGKVGDAQLLVAHLREFGAEGLLINKQRDYFDRLQWDPGMNEYFDTLAETGRARLLWIKPSVLKD